MVVNTRNHWSERILEQVPDNDLPYLFSDIVRFHSTGILRENSPLRKLDELFQEGCRDFDSKLRMVEDGLLYEMARRYNNILEQERDASISGWKLCGGNDVLLCADAGMTTFTVVANRDDNLRLGWFESEEDARDYIQSQGYVYANDGSVEIWEE